MAAGPSHELGSSGRLWFWISVRSSLVEWLISGTLLLGGVGGATGARAEEASGGGGEGGRGLHSFRFQLNLSSSIHRVTQLNPECVLELL